MKETTLNINKVKNMQILEAQPVAVKAEYIPHNIIAYNNNPLRKMRISPRCEIIAA